MVLVFLIMVTFGAAFSIGVEYANGIWEPILFLAASFINSVFFYAATNVLKKDRFVDNYSALDSVLGTIVIVVSGYSITLFDSLEQLTMLTFMMFLVSMMYIHIMATIKFLDLDG